MEFEDHRWLPTVCGIMINFTFRTYQIGGGGGKVSNFFHSGCLNLESEHISFFTLLSTYNHAQLGFEKLTTCSFILSNAHVSKIY